MLRSSRSLFSPVMASLAVLTLLLVSAAVSAQQVDWFHKFGAAGYYDEAWAVAVDATGVYVTGRTTSPLPGTVGEGLDGFVRKYSLGGKLLWSRQFNIQAQDHPFAIAVDDSGIYIAGFTEGDTYGGFVSRMTPAGEVIWTHVFDSQKLDFAWSVAVHDTGIYVGGEIARDAVIGKLGFDGREQWFSARFGTTPDDRFTDVKVDDTGVYGVGSIGAADVRRFDFNGQQIGQLGDGIRQGSSLVLDATGIYVAGHRYSSFSDYRLWKFNASGALSWSRVLQIPAEDLALEAGGLYVLQPNGYGAQPLVAKYTLGGHFIWQGVLPESLGGYDLAVREGALYIAGSAFGQAEAEHDSFLTRFLPDRPPQLRTLGEIDGSPALATLVHDSAAPSVVVRVRNAVTGATISRVNFPARLHPQNLLVLPDRNGNGAPELALLGINEANGNVVAQVRDARSGALLNSIFFNKGNVTRASVVVPGAGAEGHPALGVLGVSATDLFRSVELKDAVTGAPIRAIGFDPMNLHEPLADLIVVPDVNGNGSPELAMLAIGNEGGYVAVKDAVSSASISDIYARSCVRDVAVLPDVNGNGVVEVATLTSGCFGRLERVQVDVSDALTGEQSVLLGYGKLARPVELVPLPVFDGNGAPQLGVLALNVSADKDVLSVKDTATNEWLYNVTFSHEGYRHRDIVRLLDTNGNGRPDVAQLQERRSDGSLRIMIKDAATGAFIRVLP